MDPLVKPAVNKLVLSNYIRHADSHNKVQEEREMWRQRGLEVRSHELGHRRQRGLPLVRGRLVSDTLSPPREAEPQSYYWTRQLMRAEESDPFRWGHSGYKELHPEEFASTDSEDQKPGHKKKKNLKNKRRHKKKRKRPEKDKSRHSHRGEDLPKGLPKGKSRKSRPQESDSESEQDYARKRKKHKNRDSATESGSEEDYVLKRKRHRAGRAKKRRSSTSSDDDENHRGERGQKSKKSHKDLVSS